MSQLTEATLSTYGDLSGRISAAVIQDDLDALAGILGGCAILVEEATTALNGRVSQGAIDDAVAEAKTALGI